MKKPQQRFAGGDLDKFRHVMQTYPVQKNESKILERIADYKGMEPKKLATELLSMAIMDEQRRLKEMGVL